MDLFDLNSITASLAVGNQTSEIVDVVKEQIQSVLSPDFFVYAAVLFAGFTLSKSYFDAIMAAIDGAPKLVAMGYALAAWALSFILAWMTYWLGQLPVGTSFAHITNPKLQVMRWCFVLGSVFMALGPFLILPPIRKIIVTAKKSPLLHAIVKAAQSKSTRYVALFLFVIVTLFQFFVAVCLGEVLVFGPWFQLDTVHAVSVSFFYVMVAMFYLYGFWYAMVQKEKKEDAAKPGEESILKRLRSRFILVYRSTMCLKGELSHGIMAECDNCVRLNVLDTQAYLYTYLFLFGVVNLATFGEQVFFLYSDVSQFSAAKLIATLPSIIAMVFAAVTVITHLTGVVFLFNEAFRIVQVTEMPVPEILPQKESSTQNSDISNDYAPSAPGRFQESASSILNGRKADVSISINEDVAEEPEQSQFMEPDKSAMLSTYSQIEDEEVKALEIPEDLSRKAALKPSAAKRMMSQASSRESEPSQRMSVSAMSKKKKDLTPLKIPAAARKEASAPTSSKASAPAAVLAPSDSTLSSAAAPPPPSSAPGPPAAPSSSTNLPAPAPPSSSLMPPSSYMMAPGVPVAPTSSTNVPAPARPSPSLMPPSSYMMAPLSPAAPSPSAAADFDMEPKKMSQVLDVLEDRKVKEESSVSYAAYEQPERLVEPMEIRKEYVPLEEIHRIEPEEPTSPTLEGQLSSLEVLQVIRWLEVADRINVEPEFFAQIGPSSKTKMYEQLRPLIKNYAKALFSHFTCHILSKQAVLSELEERMMEAIPESFIRATASSYGDESYQGLFRFHFAQRYPGVPMEMLEWNDNFETTADVEKLISCLFTMMNGQ